MVHWMNVFRSHFFLPTLWWWFSFQPLLCTKFFHADDGIPNDILVALTGFQSAFVFTLLQIICFFFSSKMTLSCVYSLFSVVPLYTCICFVDFFLSHSTVKHYVFGMFEKFLIEFLVELNHVASNLSTGSTRKMGVEHAKKNYNRSTDCHKTIFFFFWFLL